VEAARRTAAILQIRLLGGFAIGYDGEPITGVHAPRLQSLLAHLVVNRDVPQPRERLAFLFWPESGEAQARTNLRQALHHLRRAVPDSERFLETEARAVRWRSDAPCWIDVAEFETLAVAEEREALESAVGLYTGDLLPDCYDDWVVPHRDGLRELFLAAAERLAELLELERDPRAALPWARRLLDHDPLNERTCRRLMRLHALTGDRAGALRVYHGFATALAREAGVAPSAETREAHQLLLDSDVAPVEAGRASAVTSPLVGRAEEWGALQAAWERAAGGEAVLAVIGGEAGIGKSRLCEELLGWVGRQGHATAASRCYSAAGGLAYAPIIELLRSPPIRARLLRLGDSWVAELARLLPELLDERPDLPSPPPLTYEGERTRLLDAVSHAVVAEARPLVLAIDDLQWCDAETLGWLHYLLRSRREAPLLVVATARSEELGPDHPAQSLLLAGRAGGQTVELELERLDGADTAALARSMSGRELDRGHQELVYRETEGNPLFVVELMRAGFAGGDAPELPPRAHSVIEARLAQLSASGQELAGLAATVGRAFTFGVLVRASSRSEEQVVEALDELWQRRIVRERGVDAYDFSHDKLRDAAYQQAGSARRRMLHGRVAQALERMHAADLDGVSGQLATHYERAGWPERAIGFYARAAEVAQRVYADEQAIELASQALGLLNAEPPTPQRDERELALRTTLGASLVALRGYGAAEVHDVYLRALELCERIGTRPDPPVLRGLALVNITRGDLQRAYELGEQLVALGEREDESMVRVEGNYVLGVTSFWLGEFATARDQLERAIAEYAPEDARLHVALYSQDPRIVCLSRLAYALSFLGEAERAEQHAQEALRLAEKLEHPFSLAYALNFAVWLAIDRGDEPCARERAERMAGLAEEQQLGFLQPMGVIYRGWMLAGDGSTEEALALIGAGLDAYSASGWSLYRPYSLALLARVCLDAGRNEDARAAISEALELSERIGQRSHEAQLHLLMGELILADGGDRATATEHLSSALDVARRQGAVPLEQRAAEALDRLRTSG
jgi:DNA-binding SARP family transcriptional activator/tetratricopeptide (TPR) repeat protein